MDLSKAFDSLNHDLLLAKLHAYGFDRNALLLMRSYLTNRWQRMKINTSFSSWSQLLHGIPQGSILGPLLFNIYLNDLFFIDSDCDVCNFADDTTYHICDKELKSLIEKLQCSSKKAIDWVRKNYMKLNESKCHLFVNGNKHECIIAKIGEANIIESNTEKLLGIHIDRDLTFTNHVEQMYKKASKKLNALIRQCKLLPFYRRRSLMKAFFESQFSYCPLVWMFHNRTLNYKINELHYRALRIIYRDETSSFDELLEKDNAVTIHHRNLQSLAVEMFKAKEEISPEFMNEVFRQRHIPEDSRISAFRSQTDFYNIENPKSVYKGLETLRELGPKIWNIVPENIKQCTSLEKFKLSIKKWKPENCPCRLCKTYIAGLGFYDVK